MRLKNGQANIFNGLVVSGSTIHTGSIIVGNVASGYIIEAKGSANSAGFRVIGNNAEMVALSAIVSSVGGYGTLTINGFSGGSTGNTTTPSAYVSNGFNHNASSVNTPVLTVNPAINQSGTAGYTLLNLAPTINTTGSGISYYIKAPNFNVTSTGTLETTGSLLVSGSSTFTGTTTLTGGTTINATAFSSGQRALSISDGAYNFNFGFFNRNIGSNYLNIYRNASTTYFDNSSGDFIFSNSIYVPSILATNDSTIGTATAGYRLSVNGSGAASGSLRVSGSTAMVGSGSTLLSIDGSSGRLFSVDDSLSGSLFSVNTAAGLPVMEAFSDNTVRIGQYGTQALFVSKSRVGIGKESNLNANLDVLGTAVISGSSIGSPAFYVTNGGVQFGSTTGFVWDATNSKLGIGTNSPSYGLHVVGTAGVSSNLGVDGYIYPLTSGNSNTMRIHVGGASVLDLGYYTGAQNSSSGTKSMIYSSPTFSPSSGAAGFIGFYYIPTINQSGTAAGISRGIYLNPTLTSAADWKSIEWLNNTGWGIYGSGTAPNYLAGKLSIGTTATGSALNVSGSVVVTGSITATVPTVNTYFVQGILNADTPVSNSLDMVIPFVDQYDTNNWYDPATNKCTPTVAGYYLVAFSGWFENLATSSSQCNIQARKNGNSFMLTQTVANTYSGQSLSATKITYMNGTTDYVDFSAYQSTGGLKNLQKGTTDGSGTWFTMHLLTM